MTFTAVAILFIVMAFGVARCIDHWAVYTRQRNAHRHWKATRQVPFDQDKDDNDTFWHG